MIENDAGTICLKMEHISKQFPKVHANDDITISLKTGEILCLLGENGAGKSTLMNILYGLYQPTRGSIYLHNNKVTFHSPKEAIKHGLGMVHQHFMLIENLSVMENIILGTEPGKVGLIDFRKARETVRELSAQHHLAINPDAKIENLSVGQQQRVEILKALYRKAKILILDEPTAVLTPQEVEDLFRVIGSLREKGVSIIIITHKLEEVKAISERVYILRRGKLVGEELTKSISKEKLAHLMVGRDVVLTVKKTGKKSEGKPIFSVKGLSVNDDKGLCALYDLSLSIRPGEIVGIAGVGGNGQRELAEAIIGTRTVETGDILFDGKNFSAMRTKQRIEHGLSYVPSDRLKHGLILPMKICENLIIGFHDKKPFMKGINLNSGEIDKTARGLVKEYDIRTHSVMETVSNLSGGNQQKVILAREFSRNPGVLIVSQPTRGLDVGAIEFIHSEILKMRDKNVAILLISMELEEIFALSDRILVMFEGRIVKEFEPEKTDHKEVGFYMTCGGNAECGGQSGE
ncbi:MAG: ABC transporter ATP-binding protein [Spirochaetales bacterium]|nr:ABC transporter ATP-binding protein [Spirochaetales bacterium]